MDCVTILAQAVETASSGAAEEAFVPMESFWNYITTLDRVEAVTFISFGVVCLMYGWRVFKILVVISFALLGLFMGFSVTDKIVGLNNQLAGGLVGMCLLGILSVPLMRWAVSVLGAVAGGILSSGIWYASGLTERYIWAGALIGMVAGGMISFIVFKIAVILFSSLFKPQRRKFNYGGNPGSFIYLSWNISSIGRNHIYKKMVSPHSPDSPDINRPRPAKQVR
ncbi:MAG: hypothetical protein ACYS17_04645 [Planctomycetota bacterium]|jgi:hypothetical protein